MAGSNLQGFHEAQNNMCQSRAYYDQDISKVNSWSQKRDHMIHKAKIRKIDYY